MNLVERLCEVGPYEDVNTGLCHEAADRIGALEKQRDELQHSLDIANKTALALKETNESLRRELEEAKRDADEYERVAANHIHANEALHKQLATQAATIAKLREAMEKIADWGGAYGPFPEANNPAWRSMALVTAREALSATESPDQVLRNGEEV